MTNSPFLCPKPVRRVQPLPPTLLPFAGDPTPVERKALRAICERGDVLMVDGRPWLLAPVTPAILDALACFEADAADNEPEAEDTALGYCPSPILGAPGDDLPGDRDDTEDDNPAGGNVEDEGEVSLGWSDGSGPLPVDSHCQLYLTHGLPIHDDLEGEHDGREPDYDNEPEDDRSYSEPEWNPDRVPTVVRTVMPDGSIWQGQAIR